MNTYRILSPSGHWHTVQADTSFIAVQQIIQHDAGQYPSTDYFRLNPHLDRGTGRGFKYFNRNAK